MSTATRPNRFLAALVGFFCLWGVYVAVGATGIGTDVGLFDIRRSLIVLGCAATFVVFWMWVMTRTPSSRREAAEPTPGRSLLGFSSLLLAGAAYVSWGVSWIAWNRGSAINCYRLGYLAVSLLGFASILAVIGLSDPQPRRGKLLGLGTLLLLGTGIVGFLIQARMTVE